MPTSEKHGSIPLILSIDAIKYPLTGIGRYAFEIAMGLKAHREIGPMHFFSKRRLLHKLPELTMPALPVGRLALSARLKNLAADWGKPLLGMYSRLGDLLDAHALNKYSGAVYHSPNYYLPPRSGPNVVTLHDLSVLKYPQYHPASRVRYMGKQIPRALRYAHVIITDSEFTRREVIEYSGFSPERVMAIPLAATSAFCPRTSEKCQDTLQKYGLEYSQYILYAGTIEPRKNLDVLLSAYELLPTAFRKTLPLVVAGYPGWSSEALHTRIRKACHDGWARYLGYVPSGDLPILFSGARSFAFCSTYEGFGLPVLEALASGVPVVCSNTSSLPEVAGDCSLLIEPEDVVGVRDALLKAAEEKQWREKAIASGLLHAKTFSWSRTVEETVSAYRHALQQ